MGQWELTDFHSCPEQHMEHMDCQRVKKLSLFPVICQFSQYRNSIYLKPVSGAFLVVGLNSGCSSHICSHSAAVFMWRALCGLILVWLDCYRKLSKSHKIPSAGFTFPVGLLTNMTVVSLHSCSNSFSLSAPQTTQHRNGKACLFWPVKPLSFLDVFVPRRGSNTSTVSD